MSSGKCTGDRGAEFQQREWFWGQSGHKMTVGAVQASGGSWELVHGFGPPKASSMDMGGPCDGMLPGFRRRLGGVPAAFGAPGGAPVPEKCTYLGRMTPRMTVGVFQHNSQVIWVPGGLLVKWEVHR